LLPIRGINRNLNNVKIIILGAGQVCTTVAQNLSNEANDITVVDQEPGLLRDL